MFCHSGLGYGQLTENVNTRLKSGYIMIQFHIIKRSDALHHKNLKKHFIFHRLKHDIEYWIEKLNYSIGLMIHLHASHGNTVINCT